MENRWWQSAVIYELYCKSFCDTNGDGIGDLPGVIEKLPMLSELGIDAIWFTPIYTSPQADNGYDVADYEAIDPRYGTMEDFKTLLDRAHSYGIRVLMDLVLNHTSDEHRWFKESRKSKDNPYRNYYIWRAPKPDGSEPNNMGNYFFEGKGSAWEYDEATGEYYLHYYSKKMPDLNWEYEPLRKDVYRMIRGWLDMGVDGFRLDVIGQIKKPAGFPDETRNIMPNGYAVDRMARNHLPGVHELIHGLYENAFKYYDIMTVGELSGSTPENAIDYVNHDRGELDMNIHFEITGRKAVPTSPKQYKKIEKRWYSLLSRNCWIVQYLTNHDGPRQVSCFGNDTVFRKKSAKLLAVLNLSMPGTPFLFQGEEIGMTNVYYDRIEDYNDPYTIGRYRMETAGGKDPETVLKDLAWVSRDNARTPYQWNGSPNAGFTTGTPWLKVNPRFHEINFEADVQSEDSVFRFYSKLIAFRKAHPAFVDGDLTIYDEEGEKTVLFSRKCARETLLVLANCSDSETEITLPEELLSHGWTEAVTNREGKEARNALPAALEPWEASVFTLSI